MVCDNIFALLFRTGIGDRCAIRKCMPVNEERLFQFPGGGDGLGKGLERPFLSQADYAHVMSDSYLIFQSKDLA